eukprot:scaffold29074_cov63-Phaeocystis_antarctica.AAC.1
MSQKWPSRGPKRTFLPLRGLNYPESAWVHVGCSRDHLGALPRAPGLVSQISSIETKSGLGAGSTHKAKDTHAAAGSTMVPAETPYFTDACLIYPGTCTKAQKTPSGPRELNSQRGWSTSGWVALRTLRLARPRDTAHASHLTKPSTTLPQPLPHRVCKTRLWFALWATTAGGRAILSHHNWAPTPARPRHGALEASRDVSPM